MRLCVRDHIFETSDLHPSFAHVTYGRCSVVLWRRSDTLRTFGFMDDVILAQAKVARRRRPAEGQRTRSRGLGYELCAVIPVAGQQTHGTTFRALKVASQLTTPGAESAVYDCRLANYVDLLTE